MAATYYTMLIMLSMQERSELLKENGLAASARPKYEQAIRDIYMN